MTDATIASKPLSSESRAATNRANALHSTGPRTAAGRQRSSLNALRHGLTGHTIVLPTEDLAAYERHVQSYNDEYRPKGATEKQLVQDLADTSWRLNRVSALETNLLTLGITEQPTSIRTSHPEAQDALAMVSAYCLNAREFGNFSIYSQRLSRQFQKIVTQLREIQKLRNHCEGDQLLRAAELLEFHRQTEDSPYDPSQDGFVFSTSEIEDHMRRSERRRDAVDAAYSRAGA